ncbi:glucose 1-dehydrogenase [Nakamurella flava]|uniref:Glucose 1-dehydrogenase n=1 Tax=Nakamurella flava TaxID=2576308 RepID=A0A4U6QDW2_9ACTN|nr:glucose 1-dehydrogenase [Nakamurella flava]TKV58407.1 glucose 1-dehydrogenase [Nakamurella flava]
MTGRLEGKVALITGAASGIGRRTAERFADEGAIVVVGDLDEAGALAAAEHLGRDALGLRLDVTDADSVAAAVASVVAQRGRLDVLVNNAGVTITGAAHDLAEDDWDREMRVNVKSVYLMSRAAWPHLVASKGNIVNTASIAALWAIPADAAYCASKAAVLMLTKCMALDGARDGVRSNCVCPGYTDTPMIQGYFADQTDPASARTFAESIHPLGRLGQPDDIASAMVYLASDDASWVTGSALTVDGGLTSGIWG